MIFTSVKSKKYLVFVELLLDLHRFDIDEVAHDPIPDKSVHLVDSSNPWYRDILVYLETQWICPDMLKGDHRRIDHQVKHYLVLNDTLYHHGADSVIWCCLIHD